VDLLFKKLKSSSLNTGRKSNKNLPEEFKKMIMKKTFENQRKIIK
jgi:hypothetical protein